MRTWLISLALIALTCTGASHQEKRGASDALRAKDEPIAVEQPQKHHDKQDNGELGESTVLKGEEAEKKALVARKVVHDSTVTALGTHGTLPGFTDYAGINAQLVTDVINGKSTGVPYLYIPKGDFSEKDLEKNEHVNALFSRVSIKNSCKKMALNGVDPKCEKATLLGKMIKVEEDSDEYKAAYEELVKKFRGLKGVEPKEYVLRKMDIKTVFVPDNEGKRLIVPMEFYKGVDSDDVVGKREDAVH